MDSISISEVSEKEANVSSWRVIKGLIPGMLGLGKVVMKHPALTMKLMSEAQGAKKRLKGKYQTKQLPYKIPAYRPEMVRPVPEQVYLRPTRYMESDAPEIVAMAHKLGAFQKPDWGFAFDVFEFVKKQVWFTWIAQLRGAVGTLQTGEGVCLDKTHLFIALCRAGGIPGRFRMAQEAFSENIYTNLTDSDPIMSDWYNSTGYFVFHAMAEVFIDGKWVPADFSMDYHFEAALGLPISRLGDEPEGTWNWALPGSVIRCEALPAFFLFFTKMALKLNTSTMMLMQERMETEGIELGEKAIAEAGGIEAYDLKARQTYKAVLPEVSKKLFKALHGEEELEM